ncbi:Ras-related protein Rac1 [Psilocybe cubensis]|uniref:Ras-related protein Rac1 n=2 Tax=Psilocybe cubensis TaxID=181762 RepID=A0ACB8H2V5_PSICU|nr:Ras-related protein Rac1 [Psilocybe cubensis]KAH9482128.1 Ras-related protein Rac1 [Psilocybe cubensis]
MVLGDSRVGKIHFDPTAINFRCSVEEFYGMKYKAGDGNEYLLAMYDTGGEYELDHFRSLYYPRTDVFLLCFSVLDPASFDNIRTLVVIEQWAPEVADYLPSAATLVVGTKVDLRHDATVIDALRDRRSAPIQYEQGVSMCKDVGAAGYVECSSLTGYGINVVFDEVVRIGRELPVKQPRRPPRACIIA